MKKFNKEFDYLIVGSGLFGSIFANEMCKAGKKCLIIDKRNHIAGNIYTENIDSINKHIYGPHIFHCNEKEIWDYVNQFATFNNFIYEPLANYNGSIYNLPFNMNTFNQLWGVITPEQAKSYINKKKVKINSPKNLEEFAISNVGKEIYEKFIYGYTFKQWNKDPKELPVSIIKRIPLRFEYSNNYFNDRYQGIPIGGYTNIIKNIIGDIEVRLKTDFFENREYFENLSNKIVFTGKIDEFFNYKFGKLEYRSLKFESQTLECDDFQGTAGVNYTSIDIPHTRIIEHKHFEKNKLSSHTIITKEYPSNTGDPFYPINDTLNNNIYLKYKKLANNFSNFIFGGRLGDYKYYDMHQVIASALLKSKNELKNYE